MKKVYLIAILAAAVVGLCVLQGTGFMNFTAADDPQTGKTLYEQFVVAGGPVVWFVLLPLSMTAVFLAANFALTIRPSRLLDKGVSQRIIDLVKAGDKKALRETGGRSDLLSVAFAKAFETQPRDWFAFKNAVADSLQDQAAELYRRIEWLALVASVSPMVGLFGTVYGMIMLFNEIVVAGGRPQPAQLAQGISVALVTTFWGLLIAIPSVTIHGIFRTRVESITGSAVSQAQSLTSELRESVARTSSGLQSGQKAKAV